MLKRKVKEITVVFENCEHYSFTPDKIKFANIENISESIMVNECQYKDGEVHDTKSCEKALLILNEKGMNVEDGWSPSEKMSHRVQNHDIVALDLTYTDDTEDYILVPWSGGEYHNDLQNNTYFSIGEEEFLAIIINREPLTLGELEEEYGI